MLGDCYAAAVVEKLSKKELMACDAIQVPIYYNSNVGDSRFYYRIIQMDLIITLIQTLKGT